MKTYLKTLATLALLSGLAAGSAQTTASSTSQAPTAHKRPTAKKADPAKPSVASQIQELREEMQTQIQQLRQQIADRDLQLQQAQQAAAAAQAAAAQAQQQSSQQSQAVTENTQAVNSLQGAVSDMKTVNTSLATTVQTVQSDQANVQKAIGNPDAITYKGVTLTPAGSFLAAETVYRNHATGSDINTPFTSIPLNDSAQAQYSEFYGSGRQSRVAMFATGNVTDRLVLHGYYEADWLSSGTTSNNNQSNSYTMRQRQLWAQAHLGSLTFTGGQMWSLATETTSLTQNKSEILPSTIDSQYTAGFVWARQYGFRVSEDFGTKASLAVAAENAQILGIAGHGIPTDIVIGEAGTGGGLYNAYSGNYASNVAPDIIAKLAFEPGWGHYEVFGIGRFFRARIYPDATASTPSAAGAYNDTTTGGGIGGSLRVPTFRKHLDVGLKGLWGDGIGRYGSSTIADTTAHPDGTLDLIHGFSALSTLEFHVTPRLDIYANYGEDYADRTYTITKPGTAVGYGSPYNVETGCDTEPPPTSANAGFTPGSQSNCTADTKDIQEFVLGYWFNFYNGTHGRLRQGIQYSYFDRAIWSGIGTTPQATSNMFWTSFRYYLP